MPPPPMVPGKHNMDIGTWDSPSKNGPALVPPPPPVITPSAPIEPSPLSQNKSNQAMAPAPSSLPSLAMGGQPSVGPPLNMHSHHRIGSGPSGGGGSGNTGGGSTGGGSGNGGPPNRPAWSGPNNRGGGPHPGMMANMQNQRPNNMGQGK